MDRINSLGLSTRCAGWDNYIYVYLNQLFFLALSGGCSDESWFLALVKVMGRNSYGEV